MTVTVIGQDLGDRPGPDDGMVYGILNGSAWFMGQ